MEVPKSELSSAASTSTPLTTRVGKLGRRYLRYIIAYELTMLLLMVVLVQLSPYSEADHSMLDKRQFFYWTTTTTYEYSPQRCEQQKHRALIMAIFLGIAGGDQWYARRWLLGLLKTLSLGGLGIWWFIDIWLWAYHVHQLRRCGYERGAWHWRP